MKRVLVLAAAILFSACATQSRPPADLPRGSVWIEHLQRDLVPFWTMPDALGRPVGNFPTFRCHDGRRFDRASNPCPELLEAGAWISDNLDREYPRMLLLAPILPDPHRAQWKRDLVRLADGMVTRYWDAGEGMFRGTIHDPAQKLLGSRHTDFGHTIKALWMIERVGRLAGRADLVAFARGNAAPVLKRAWVEDSGCWATGIREDGSLDRALVWWSFAELDQTMATLALTDRAAARDLPAAYRCWFAKLVDREHHEVWGFVDPDDPSRRFAKAHLWKNGYHSAEHALVGYLAAQELHGEPATLWFAFHAEPAQVRAYFFDARVRAVERVGKVSRVTFVRMR